MKMSEQVNEIFKAFSEAQAEMSAAKKGAQNPFFRSTYADLESVVNAIKEPFLNHGLSFFQSTQMENGLVGVSTLITHSSGQWLESDMLWLPITKNDPQAVGSAVTYGRRYSLQAMVGLPASDDDGNAASQSTQQVQKGRAPQKAPAGPKDDQGVAEYVGKFQALIKSEDGAGLKALGSDLKGKPVYQDVWAQLSATEKASVRDLIAAQD